MADDKRIRAVVHLVEGAPDPDPGRAEHPGVPAKEAKAWRWIIFASVVLASWVGVMLWRAPVFDPPTVGAFLLDRVLQISVVVALVCAVLVLVVERSVAFRAALVACLCLVAICVSVLGGGLRPPRDVAVLVFTGLTLAVVAGMTWWLWTRRPQDVNLGLPAIVAGALVGAALPLLQLWASTSFTFGAEHVSLEATISTTVDAVSDDGSALYVAIAVTHKNPSHTRALVLLSQTTACWAPPGGVLESDVRNQRTSTSCTSWQALPERGWVDAGSELTSSRVIPVPAGSPHLHVTTRAEYAREDRMRFVQARPVFEAERLGECTKVERFQIRDDARFRAVAQQNKYLQYGIESDGGRRYWLVWGDDPPCPAPVSTDLAGYYATTSLAIDAEDWLTVPQPPG
ncbi:MAG: hypothetical protein AAGC49_13870 [Brevundimonas sp.]